MHRAALILLIALLCGCASNLSQPLSLASLGELTDDEVGYVCPMHADVTSDKSGNCEKCGMPLVMGRPFDMRDYGLEFSSLPVAPRAGESVRLQFRVVRPGSGETVTDFELVHEMPFHLFVLSQDAEFFEHVHPTMNTDGVWELDTVLPKAGAYVLVSDFAPKGSSSQMTLRPLVTQGASEDLLHGLPELRPDRSSEIPVRDLTASVSFDPVRLTAGEHGHLTFNISHTKTGLPVTDLQTYLGAFGHLFVMNEDMAQYVHSHPVETPSPALNLADLRGGPGVMFEGILPKPGRYRAWAQFRYRNEIYTFPTTFQVADVGE